MRKVLLTVLFSLCAVSASAVGVITSISPSSVKVNSGEHFITVYGTGLGDTLIFTGPAGSFKRTVTATFSNRVVGWVPERVVMTAGTYSLVVRGNDGDSNAVNFVVEGFKFWPLAILVPDAIFQQALSRDGGNVKYEVFAFGGEDPEPIVSCLPKSGDWFKMGQTRVLCNASNRYGEKATAEFSITVQDREAPKLVVPDPIRTKWTSNEGAIVDFKVTAYDDIYGDVAADCLPRAGSTFPVGVTTVNCTAADFDGNIGNGTFTVEVLGDFKPYPLEIDVPNFLQVEAASSRGSVVDYNAKITNSEDPRAILSCLPKSGDLFPVGQTVVRCDALDIYGMRGSAEFNVDVFDPAPPDVLSIKPSPSDLSPADDRIVSVEVGIEAFDKIDDAPFCSIFAVTSNEDIDLDDGANSKDYQWLITGQLTVDLRARTTTGRRIYYLWASCTDFYGNATQVRTPVLVYGSALTPNTPVQTPTKRRAARP